MAVEAQAGAVEEKENTAPLSPLGTAFQQTLNYGRHKLCHNWQSPV
jgi:hypothetical protein